MAESAGIGIRNVTPQQHTSRAIIPGDTIEYSVTHEVETVRGDKFWVKYGVTSSVQGGEIAKDAVARVAEHVNTEIMARIEESAHRALTGGNK